MCDGFTWARLGGAFTGRCFYWAVLLLGGTKSRSQGHLRRRLQEVHSRWGPKTFNSKRRTLTGEADGGKLHELVPLRQTAINRHMTAPRSLETSSARRLHV